MSRQHFKQPLIVISPMFKNNKSDKKLNFGQLTYKQKKQQTVQQVIFAMRYKEKYQQKQKLTARNSQFFGMPKTSKDDFQNKLLNVLKKQNSTMLTCNLVNISFVNGLQGSKIARNLRNTTALSSSRNQSNEKMRYSSTNLLEDNQTKRRMNYRRSCQAKDLKQSLKQLNDNYDNKQFQTTNQPCLISSLKLKHRPETSKLRQKQTPDQNHKYRFTSRKSSGYNNLLKNLAKPIKKQDLLQPWISADPVEQW